MKKKRNQKRKNILTIIILILIIPGLFFGQWFNFIKIKEARAAEINIDSTTHTSASSHSGSTPTVVFTSDQNGYAFYRDSTGSCVYTKTINGGTSWSAAVTVDAQTDCYKVGVWYDQWTPGDTSGTNIHIVTMDAGDLWYTKLDTSTDTLTTVVNASAANQGGGFAVGGNIPSITKSTTGIVYMGIQDAADSFVIKCSTTCDNATNWTEAGTSPFDLAVDELILMPLSGGNIIAIRRDTSADVVGSKVYTASGSTWDVSWTTIDAAATKNATYDAQFGATLNRVTGDIYLAYAADTSAFGSNDDIRTAIYSSGSWTAKTDVLTNDTKGITGAKIAFNENNNDVYVLYSARATAGTASTGNVYYKKSTDGMSTWGTETQVNTTTGDIYGARLNILSNERFYATWDSSSVDDLFGNTVVDLTPPTFAESAYRLFTNANSTDVGSALATQDTAATLASSGSAFRLRLLLHIGGDGAKTSFTNFKLQFAQRSGTCDTSFSGETYADVTGSTVIAYKDNATPSDGASLTANASDPTHSSDTIVNQTYEELNNFTNSVAAIGSGKDGKWDFSLFDNGATAGTNYCLRAVKSDGTTLTSYSVVPEIITAAASDTTAPAAVSNLALSGATASSMTVSWTAPGDDNSTGTATTYDLRYSTSLITSGNFSSATQVTGEPTPSLAGSSESMSVTGLSAATTYYFALKTSDEASNTSTISNVPNATTSAAPDTTAPSAVSNLAVSSMAATATTLTWTAPGDDNGTGTATTYDLRYSTATITSGNFSSATQVTGEPAPSVAGSSETMTITGLSQLTTYYFAIKTSDEVPNTSAISNVPNGTTSASADVTAPAAVSNLATSNITSSGMTISWTAPGDDNNTGTATTYDLRYSTSLITSGNFSSATQVTGEPTPSLAGSSESMSVTGLSAATTYYFAIKTSDEVPNTSAISNVPSETTLEQAVTTYLPPTSGGRAPPTFFVSGQAYPGGTIEVFRKGNVSETYLIVPAISINIKDDGSFEVSQVGVVTGEHFYALRIKDRDKRETVLTFDVDLLTQNLFSIVNLLISPTVELKNTLLARSEDLHLVGYAGPNNTIEVEVDGIINKDVIHSDQNGYYSILVNTDSLAEGAHSVRVRQIAKDGTKSNWALTKTFKKSSLASLRADFNNNGKVDITDWSIFLFRWGSQDQKLRLSIDLNDDKSVNITDLSIFFKLIGS